MDACGNVEIGFDMTGGRFARVESHRDLGLAR